MDDKLMNSTRDENKITSSVDLIEHSKLKFNQDLKRVSKKSNMNGISPIS